MNKITLLLIGASLCYSYTTKYHTNKSLPIMELGYKTEKKIVDLPNDYGFLIYWPANNEPELYLYDKPANKINMTSDFSVFLSSLRLFPSGIKIDRISGCAITAIGMPEHNKALLNEVIKDKKFRLTDSEDGNFGVCSCETTYVRRYKTTNGQMLHGTTSYIP